MGEKELKQDDNDSLGHGCYRLPPEAGPEYFLDLFGLVGIWEAHGY